MLSDKQKKKLFKQYLHDLRKTIDSRELHDYYKNNRCRVLSLIDEFSVEEEPLESYKEKLSKVLGFTTQSAIETAFQPMKEERQKTMEERQETMDSILQNIYNLRSDIKTGIIDLDKIDTSSQCGEWGGAGVIISSDRSREGGQSCFVVHTNHAQTIAWLIFRLRDLASRIINYQNKYKFYGKIAENTQKYIEKNGDSKEFRRDLLIQLLDEVICLIESWK